MNDYLKFAAMSRNKSHDCCFHTFRGPLMMVVPDGHVVEKCCKCSCTRTVHVEHRSTKGVSWSLTEDPHNRPIKKAEQCVELHPDHFNCFVR